MSPMTVPTFSLSPQGRRAVSVVLVLGAIVGVLLGIETLAFHLSTDALDDTRRYYEAGARLNAGQPLYGVTSPGSDRVYLYPPLLAILFRPLALLPFPVAAVIWEVVIVGALLLALRRIGWTRRLALVACWLALPIAWALTIGNVEPALTLLLTVGTPATVALAGHVKLLPWLVAAYWVGRRDRRALARFATWVAVLGLVQLLLEPAATVAFVRLEWLKETFGVRNASLYATHPALWLVGAAVAFAVALRMARSRWGWPASVALTVVANPRLLLYQLTSLLAALGGPVASSEPDAVPEPAA